MTDVAGKAFQIDTRGTEDFMTIVCIHTSALDTIESDHFGTFGALCFVHLIITFD